MASNNDEDISMLLSMGFDRSQALHALNACGNLERAIDFLLNGGVGGGDATSGHQNQDATYHTNATAQIGSGDSGAVRAVHSSVSQYTDTLGRSACTSIALTMACKFLTSQNTTTNNNNTETETIINSTFLSESIQDGIKMYTHLTSIANSGVEHSSVEELLNICSSSNNNTSKNIATSMKLLHSSPRQGILTNNSANHPMGLESVLSSCIADHADVNATTTMSYIAVVITKPPETILVLLPISPQQQSSTASSSSSYILLDSHPRPQQLSPHYPSGSYALFHPNLMGLVASLKRIFPVVDLGHDVPEMMAMMYNSFDVYPFRHQGR
mmetsp:Transcript_36078/g.77768  ORF Transcript_36078/g.77768 Transcript_36078/m.77768 type:complete len:327 (-) Transcript_36078:180-1160(-)